MRNENSTFPPFPQQPYVHTSEAETLYYWPVSDEKSIISVQYGCNYLDLLSSCSVSSLAKRHGGTVMAPESFSPSPLPCWEFKAQIGSWISCLSWISYPATSKGTNQRKKNDFLAFLSAQLYKCSPFGLVNPEEHRVVRERLVGIRTDDVA